MMNKEEEKGDVVNHPEIVEMGMTSHNKDNVLENLTTGDEDLRPDDILKKLGGCGLFQILLGVVVHTMKFGVTWGMGATSFFAYVPKWRCTDKHFTQNYTAGGGNISMNVTLNGAYWNEICNLPTGGKCQHFEFEGSIHTIVSEFDLVCDKSWVTATVISVQYTGMLLGSLVAGHLSDIFGRKKPFISSMAILVVSHLICYFSVNWVMFAVGRFFVGIASAFFLSIRCILQGEYMLSKWRSVTVGFPSWPILMCVFTLLAWLLHDWEWLTLIIIIGSGLFLLTWFFIPESFRWLVARGRLSEARAVVFQVEKWNKRSAPEFDKIVRAFSDDDTAEPENYTMLVLFRHRTLLKTTLLLITGWLGLGLIGYGIGFGLKSFSGNYYLNLFLHSILCIPTKCIAIYLQNVIGRKYSSAVLFCICMICGGVVGMVQYIDTPMRGGISNGFALTAGAVVEACWGPMQTWTVELYPTVARTTGFGFLSILARFGAVIGPQFVYLEEFVPGLLYFVIAGLAAVSTCCVLCLPETMNTTLTDKLSENEKHQRRQE